MSIAFYLKQGLYACKQTGLEQDGEKSYIHKIKDRCIVANLIK